MSEPNSIDNDFIKKISGIIEDNLSNEQFGVSELADEIGMSRSNLLRKIKKATNLSVSQYIRNLRLEHAMELLKDKSFTVSEVSYKVGFNSTSYFIKCFHDHYGYSPGEVGKRNLPDSININTSKSNSKKVVLWSTVFFIFLISVIVIFLFIKPFSNKEKQENSIAVLPFKNDSNDSTNIYLINGLMESVLNNLQKIEDVRVISRTSVEKYRTRPQSAPEIASELRVNYLVEGSGQKINDQIVLNIQLIEGSTDSHLWAKQYSREVKDIFQLQKEIAKDIARHIEVIITPEEEENIDKTYTDDLIAYDYFLKGLDLFYKGDRKSIEEAISWYEKAIERDNEFARAYAGIAIAYYIMEAGQSEKQYANQINYYSDQALLFDPKLPQALIAKALFYMNSGENELAIPYLDKALEYNPNSALVINTLSDFYTSHVPNTEKYLEYALKGIRLDPSSNDSLTTSFIYLHISNAFIQSGFINEAKTYIDKSLAYHTDNLFSQYVKAYILYAENKNLEQLQQNLSAVLEKDTTRLDVLQEVGKSYYYLRDFENAFTYYKKFVTIKETYNLDIYKAENAKIGLVYAKMGMDERSEQLLSAYKNYADGDQSIYKHLSLSAYLSFKGEKSKAIEHLQLFSRQDNFHYWVILFLEIDPLFDNIKQLPEFKLEMENIKTKFNKYHIGIKNLLDEKGLI